MNFSCDSGLHAENTKGNVVDKLDSEEMRWPGNHCPGGDHISDASMMRRCYIFQNA